MREDLLKLSLVELKELAKQKGLKGVSALRKPEIIERILEQEKGPETAAEPETKKAPEKVAEPAVTENPEKEEAVREEKPAPQAKPARKNYTTTFRPGNLNGRTSFGRSDNRSTYNRDTRNNFRNNSENTETRTSTRIGSENAEPKNSYRSNENTEPKNSYRSNSEGTEAKNSYRSSENAEMKNSSNELQETRGQYRATPSEVRVEDMDLGTAAPLGVEDIGALDSGETASGILEVMGDGFGFIRCENYMPGENDVYVSPSQIRRFNMKTGDIVTGAIRIRTGNEKFAALLYVKSINGEHPSVAEHRKNFEDLTPIFPNSRLHLETPGCTPSMRMVDLFSPIGKGQRGMIVSPPKAGKTTLLKQVAGAITKNHQDMHLIILLIDERPEEVTDIKESIEGDNVEVIYSTFDEQPDHHRRVSEMVLGRAKRLVEHGHDVVILLDSITRLARAYNLVVPPSGRTLSGGLDPTALYMPKKFFGAARNMREGGSLTILATALVDTGSRMDDVVFEEFKGTGNMELVLDRKLSEKRVFPAIDLLKSGTRRDDLLLTREEAEAIEFVRKAVGNLKPEEATEKIIDLFLRTKNNREFIQMAKKIRW